MAYHCRSCGFTKITRFPQGCCPACRSFDIYSDQQNAETEAKPKPYRLLFLLFLAVVLAVLLYEKFSSA